MDNLTIVIPFRNGHATIERLLASIPAHLPVIIIDDASDAPARVARDNTRVIRLENRGYFSGAVNAGLEASSTDVLVLNQDVWLEGRAWLDLIALREKYAMLGDGVIGHPAWPAGYVQGTFMFMRRDAIQRVGGLNVLDYPLWGATCEWQLRACRMGYRAFPCSRVGGLNHERRNSSRFGASITAALEESPEKRDWFIRTPPSVSVIVPCHNYGRYLDDLMASLTGGESCLGYCPPQTFQSFEIIIVDDASKDDSGKIADALADPWKAVRVFHHEKNKGTAAAINTGIRAAWGRYVTVLSADDMMEPHRLERLYRTAEANPHRVIYDDLTLVKGGKRTETLALPDYDFERVLYKNCMHAGIFYEKSAWAECNGYPEVMADGREDWAFNVALGAKGYCGVHVREPMYLYRREHQNRSLRNSDMRAVFLGRLQSLYPNLYKGEFPMGCCGGSKRAAPARQGAASPKAAAALVPVGAAGMTLVEYTGQKAGSMLFGGDGKTPTGQQYVFGGGKRLSYVDNRDLSYFLQFIEGRGHVFKRREPVKPHLAAAPIALPAEPDPAPLVPSEPEPVKAEPEPAAPCCGKENCTCQLPAADEPERPVIVESAEPPKRTRRRKAG